MSKLQYTCVFCGKDTDFKDGGKAYCVDCYVKIRNSAHTHDVLPVNPWPVTPMPMPVVTPSTTPAYPWYGDGDLPKYTVTC